MEERRCELCGNTSGILGINPYIRKAKPKEVKDLCNECGLTRDWRQLKGAPLWARSLLQSGEPEAKQAADNFLQRFVERLEKD